MADTTLAEIERQTRTSFFLACRVRSFSGLSGVCFPSLRTQYNGAVGIDTITLISKQPCRTLTLVEIVCAVMWSRQRKSSQNIATMNLHRPLRPRPQRCPHRLNHHLDRPYPRHHWSDHRPRLPNPFLWGLR